LVAFAYMSRRRLVGRFMPDDLPAAASSRQAGTTVARVLRRPLRLAIGLGLLAGIAYAVAKVLRSDEPAPPKELGPGPRAIPPRTTAAASEPELEPEPEPALRSEPEPVAPAVAWVEPDGDVCPTTHPVKAKLSSKIFHLPGMSMYDRTRPDRCYAGAAEAEADGLRAAKR
jgi:hypothetical protein